MRTFHFQLFIMASPSGILTVFLYDQEANDQKILITQNFNFEINYYNIINKYVIYQFNLYIVINDKNDIF